MTSQKQSRNQNDGNKSKILVKINNGYKLKKKRKNTLIT